MLAEQAQTLGGGGTVEFLGQGREAVWVVGGGKGDAEGVAAGAGQDEAGAYNYGQGAGAD